MVTTIQPGFAAFRGPAERKVFEPGFWLWQRLCRLCRALLMLPDRGPAADELPPEYFRYPPV